MKAKQEGRKAAIYDGRKAVNPYSKGSIKHTYWNKGFRIGLKEMAW